MSPASSPPVPGWWQRTWPLVLLGVLSVTMWTGRIRNIVGDDSITGAGRVIRLALAVSFVIGGAVLLVGCVIGRPHRNWRKATRREDDGWRIGPGVPTWATNEATGLCAWTAVVWSVQGVGILVDPHHDVGFKVVHTVLMVGSLIVAATAAWGLRRTWPVAPTARVG